MTTTGRLQSLQSNDLAAIDVDEILCSGSDDDYYDSPNERQRQYEIQKQRFLQGKSLTIVSAQLRGPFTKESGWQNPWLGTSKGTSRAKHGPTKRVAQSSPTGRLSNAGVFVPDSTTKNDTPRFGRTHITVPPLKMNRLTQSSSYQLPSPVSSSSYATTINPYMDSAAWTRVQSWRIDIAAKTESVEELRPMAAPSVKILVQTATRSKRPASSELLRNALAKKRRSSGLDQSVVTPMSTSGHNHSPFTSQRQGSDSAFSTPEIQSPGGRHVSLNNLSEAALDGSVAEQTPISRALQMNVTPAENSGAGDGFFTTTRVALGGTNGIAAPSTPTQQSRSQSTGRRSGVVPEAPESILTPLRPDPITINCLNNAENLTQDSREAELIQGTVELAASVEDIEARGYSASGFCSQADRSFQYRSKALSISKRHAAIEGPNNVSRISSQAETGSENIESVPEPVPHKDSKEAYSPNHLAGHTTSALPDGAMTPSNMTNGANITIQEDADHTAPGIDGPTLVPTSSTPSQRQAVLPSNLRPETGVEAEAYIRQHTSFHGDYALPGPGSTSKLKPSRSQVVKVLSQRPSIAVGHPKVAVHSGIPEESGQIINLKSYVDMDTPILRTSMSHLGSSIDQGGEVNLHEQPPSQEGGATLNSPTSPADQEGFVGPHQQSPWTKGFFHVSQPTPGPQVQSLTLQTHLQEPPCSKLNETPRVSKTAATPLQQSPWTKDNALPTVVIDANQPSLPLADYAKQDFQGTEAVETTASQNPWVFDGGVGEKTSALGESPPLPTSPGCLRLTGAATSPISTKSSPAQPTANTVQGEAPTKQAQPSTPTQQSSLPTPDLTSSIRSFRDFMSPSPEPARRLGPLRSSRYRIERINRRKSAFFQSEKDRSKKAHLRVSFDLPNEISSSSQASNADPDETLEGAELPTREATSPSLVRQATIHAPSQRASSPPPEISQSELPAEGTVFSKYFHLQARRVRQAAHSAKYKPLLPSESQQTCGSPEPDAMAEAFIEADRAIGEQNDGVDNGYPSEEDSKRGPAPEAEHMLTPDEETDDVTAVLDHLDDYLNTFNVDAELDRAGRAQDQHRDQRQDMGFGFPSTQDQMEIIGAGVWD